MSWVCLGPDVWQVESGLGVGCWCCGSVGQCVSFSALPFMFFHNAFESWFQLFEQGVSSIFADARCWVIMGALSLAIGVALSKNEVLQAYVVGKAGHVESTFVSTRDACFHQ